MMGKFTPGPWRAVRNSAYWEVEPQNRRDEDPYSVADCCCSAPDHPDAGLQEANARLIAAAPEMLEALKIARADLASAFRQIVGSDEHSSTIKAIDAAIAKAEGEP